MYIEIDRPNHVNFLFSSCAYYISYLDDLDIMILSYLRDLMESFDHQQVVQNRVMDSRSRSRDGGSDVESIKRLV